MEPTLHAVLRSAECVAGDPSEPPFHQVRVGDSDLLVVRLADGAVVAFSAECPHQATPLEGATFFEGRLRCGRHLYLYDLGTGENIIPARDVSSPEALRRLKPGYLPIHRTEDRDGWIWVSDTPEPAPACFDPAAERPLAPGATPAAATPASAPAPAPGPATVGGAAAEGPETMAVRVGDTFDLVVATVPRPAHMWRSSLSGTGVEIVSEGFAPDQPPRHIARLVARRPGEVEVRFTYSTPWDPTPVETRSFVVRIE